jgi:hypothetical protein
MMGWEDMMINSPIGNLIETLKQIRETALVNQSKLSKSEASTRSAIIDPILRALGWDTANPRMIEFEKTFTQSRVDYALLDSENKIQIIIEAKPLGGNLSDKHILLSLIMYAIASGVKSIFLTDGVIWEHYTDYSPGNVVSSKTLDLAKDNLLDCAAYLIQIMDAARFWQSEPQKVEPEAEQLSKQILDLRSEISVLKNTLLLVQKTQVEKVAGEEVKTETSSKPAYRFVDLDQISSFLGESLTNQKPPNVLKFPDGTTKEITRWGDILLECCNFVLVNNPNVPIPLPDAAGKKIKLLDTQPPAKGVAHHKYVYGGRQIFIHANYDSNHCVTNALYILRKVETGKAMFQVGFTAEAGT